VGVKQVNIGDERFVVISYVKSPILKHNYVPYQSIVMLKKLQLV